MQLEKKIINISGQIVWLMLRQFICWEYHPFAHIDKTSVADNCMVEGDGESSQFHVSEFREAPGTRIHLCGP